MRYIQLASKKYLVLDCCDCPCRDFEDDFCNLLMHITNEYFYIKRESILKQCPLPELLASSDPSDPSLPSLNETGESHTTSS